LERLPYGIQGLAEVCRGRTARLGLVEDDHEGVGDGFSQRAQLLGCVRIDPV
jgi:hypothetical protein